MPKATLAALVLALPCSIGVPDPGKAILRPADTPAERIERYLESVEFFGWSGVAIVEHKGKVILHRGFGLSDPETERPNDQDTVFEIASITKPITAAAVMSLVETKVLDLDEPVSKYLPGVPPAREGITVRHLLAHTSGMPRTSGGTGATVAEVVKSCLGSEPTAKPGVRHEYWNGGYALLAAIIESVTEEGYMDYCRKALFEPLALSSTGFTGDAIWSEDQEAVAQPSSGRNRRASGHPYGAYDYRYRGMGGVVTTAEELLALGHGILDAKVLKKRTVKEMLTPPMGTYALGWGIVETSRGTTRIGHGGDVAGFHSQMQFFPDEEAAVVVTSNVDGVPMWHLSWNIEALLLGGDLPYPAPPGWDHDPVDLEPFEGTYGLDTGGRLEVVAVGRGLELRPSGLDAGVALAGGAVTEETKAVAKRATDLIVSFQEGEVDGIRENLAQYIPPDWPSRVAKDYLPAHLEKWGPILSMNAASCSGVGSDYESCLVALEHEAGRSYVEVAYRSDYYGPKLQIFRLGAKPDLGDMRFAPALEPGNKRKKAEALRFERFRWDPRGVKGRDGLLLVFDEENEGTLTLTHPDGSEIVATRP